MSFAVDANILIYASNTSAVHHEEAARLLAEWVAGHEILYFPWPVLMAYLRISTHPAIFDAPLKPHEAQQNVDTLLSVPHVRVLGEGRNFWKSYGLAIQGMNVRGNLVPDALIVALMLEHGVREIVSNDTDFRKFEGIRVTNPFA